MRTDGPRPATDERPSTDNVAATDEARGASEDATSEDAPWSDEPDPALEVAVVPRFGFLGRSTEVPVRTILTSIGLVLGTVAVLWLLDKTSRMITWVLLAAFFAIVLNPLVDWMVRHARLRRSLAVTVVVLLFLASLTLLVVAFVRPLAKQGTAFANDFPGYLKDAQEGRGRIGQWIRDRNLDEWVTKNLPVARDKVKEFFQPSRIFGSAVGAIGSVFNVLAGILTVSVLTILMLLEGHTLLQTAIRPFSPERQERFRRVSRDASKAITGYVNGNLLISIIAGLTTWIVLVIQKVPYSGVLALWVAFADLIPLVGATMGAIAAVGVAFLSSTTAGVVTLIFYVLYQQFENHVLQVWIMSRTVALKPLVVLVSVLFGVELFGLLGALLAIPIAGVIKVVSLDILYDRRPDLLPTRTR